MPKSFMLATILGLLLGVALVGWADPQTSSGRVFLIVICALACNVIGAFYSLLASRFAKPGATAAKGADRHD